VILDQLETLDAAPLRLPMPADARARALADRLARDPALPIARAIRSVGASRRTLERVFARETQMTLGRWTQRLRLVEALRLLGSGRQVAVVALDVGYASASAFGAAFRRVLGTTPGRYFA
jgi:AraC-like DNA-binding protein